MNKKELISRYLLDNASLNEQDNDVDIDLTDPKLKKKVGKIGNWINNNLTAPGMGFNTIKNISGILNLGDKLKTGIEDLMPNVKVSKDKVLDTGDILKQSFNTVPGGRAVTGLFNLGSKLYDKIGGKNLSDIPDIINPPSPRSEVPVIQSDTPSDEPTYVDPALKDWEDSMTVEGVLTENTITKLLQRGYTYTDIAKLEQKMGRKI